MLQRFGRRRLLAHGGLQRFPVNMQSVYGVQRFLATFSARPKRCKDVVATFFATFCSVFVVVATFFLLQQRFFCCCNVFFVVATFSVGAPA